MEHHSELREIEDISCGELKNALWGLWEGMSGAAVGHMPISKIELPDGRIGKIFIKIETDATEFFD